MEIYDIAIHGTSLTVDRSARDWLLLWARATQVGRSTRIKIYLTGREGEASDYGLANIQPVVALKPKAAILEWINDANPAQGVSVAQSVANHTAMLAAIASGSPSTQLYIMLASQPRADAVAATFPNLVANDAALRSLASSYGCGLIDIRAAWGDPNIRPNEYAPEDGIHPLLAGWLRVGFPKMTEVFGPLIP